MTNTTANHRMQIPEEIVLGTAIHNTYLWVLVAVGLPGNLACLVTVLSMQVTTATFYVALLAAADSMALLMHVLFRVLTSHGKLTKAACLFYLLPNFFSCYANLVLALICLERFFAVCYPLKKQVYFTKRRVYISVVVLAVALLFYFSPTPLFYPDVRSAGRRCAVNGDKTVIAVNMVFYAVFPTVYFFIPFLLIAVFTTLIIVSLQRHRRARQRMNMVVSGGGAARGGSAERSVSLMLLGEALVFLLLTLPSWLYYYFLQKTYNLRELKESAESFLFFQVITMLGDINHAVNFIIYFLSAAKFRKRFVELLKRCLCCLKRQ